MSNLWLWLLEVNNEKLDLSSKRSTVASMSNNEDIIYLSNFGFSWNGVIRTKSTNFKIFPFSLHRPINFLCM